MLPVNRSGKPLLEVDKLTLRFRGLTAVNAVDVKVRSGEIYAVIGPNGAGKTSLFNAITGIYEPTSGTVSFEGQDLCRPLTRAHYVRWGIVGLAVGFVMFLLAADVNVMWAAVVKQNYQSKQAGFQTSQAMSDLWNYLAARPRIEQKQGRFFVTTHDGRTPYGSSKTLEEAKARQAAVIEMGKLDPKTADLVEDADGAVLKVGDQVLDRAPTREQIEGRIKAAREADGAAAAARRKRVLAFLFGLFLGSAGSYAVFRQTRRTPASVAARGIARTFQNIRLFQDMTVQENVLVGMDRHLLKEEPWLSTRRLAELAAPLALGAVLVTLVATRRFAIGGPGLWGTLVVALVLGTIAYLVRIGRLGAFSRSDIALEAVARAEAQKLLDFVGLAPKKDELAKNLAYGDQRRLEIARALATKPRLLLLDEPAAGMNPAETVSLMKLIKDIRDRSVTVLLIEHHMRVVMGISDRIAVLEYGQKIAEGTPDEIRANPKVIEAYLGKEELG